MDLHNRGNVRQPGHSDFNPGRSNNGEDDNAGSNQNGRTNPQAKSTVSRIVNGPVGGVERGLASRAGALGDATYRGCESDSEPTVGTWPAPLAKGRRHLEQALPRIVEDAELKLSGMFRVLLAQLQRELDQLGVRIEQMDTEIQREACDNEACQRLTAIPGVGPVTATALVAAIGNGSTFGKGRDLSAWMGIVPGEYSTGGKQKLLGISKRGNKYLRRLFVQGARSVLQHREKQVPALSRWLAGLLGRAHQNVVIVALANKLVRIAWAVLCKNECYRAPALPATT